MYWNELSGSIFLGKVFSAPVEISQIDIFEIKIDREAATVIIIFDLVDSLPDIPVPKWPKYFDRCRCGINCVGTSELLVSGISVEMLAHIEIEKNDTGEVLVNILGPNLKISLQCMHVQFTGPSVY